MINLKPKNMENVLFLQSEIKDPNIFYARMRSSHPVYYDETNKIWGIYDFKHCEILLQASVAHVPVLSSKLNEHNELSEILNKLARLNNGLYHTEARTSAMNLLACWKNTDAPALLHVLVGEPRLPATVDWVNSIAKKLPALTLLRGFDFPADIASSILPEIENLAKLMTPVDRDEDVAVIEDSVRKVKEAFDDHLIRKLPRIQDLTLYAANFIGLLIQSYDATRGLLSNALLDSLIFFDIKSPTREDFSRFVRESARLNPTVHNTRRIMQKQERLGRYEIPKGAEVLLVLASANRDASRFYNADSFLISRTYESLSFGSGVHKCIAENFSTQLTASVLHYLYTKYQRFEIKESEVQYEPRINVRLPKKITLVIS
jgi:hypothetical protein